MGVLPLSPAQVSFDRSVIMHMVQLRADYKAQKLNKVFNQ